MALVLTELRELIRHLRPLTVAAAALAVILVLAAPYNLVELEAFTGVVLAAQVITSALVISRGVLALEAAAQSALSGPARPALSHRLTRGTSNAFVQRGLVTLPAVSGARARPVACDTRRAYDWCGDAGHNHVSDRCVYRAGLHRRTCRDHGLPSHFDARLHYRNRRIFSGNRIRVGGGHCVHVSGTRPERNGVWEL